MKIKLILENASGALDESNPIDVIDETDVSEEVERLLWNKGWSLTPGDVIRIVEA